MSRRSSFGYSSYGSRSYRSGSYRSRRSRNNKAKAVIIVLSVILIACGGAFAVYSFLLRGKPSEIQKEPAAALVSNASAAAQPSNEPPSEKKESSAQSSAQKPDIKGYHDGNVFMYDGQGYEMFYGTDSSAAYYASAVSEIKKQLGADIRVYNMVVPNHSAFGLPEKYLSDMNDERSNIQTIYTSYTEDVIPIDVFDAEEQHKDEYTFFRTDNNWTALGAYYAYQEFGKALKTKSFDLGSLSKGSITGFKGSLFVATQTEENPNGNKELAAKPDTVIYYHMPNVERCILLENGKSEEQEVPMIATFAEGSNAYSAFIWGNNPYMNIKTSHHTGKKLCIIKDSYGCAFAPFAAADFDEIYVVDPGYYDGSIIDYLKQNRYTDVLVLNNIMTANTEFRVKDIFSILG